MKSEDWDEQLHAEQREYIREEGAREAFDLLVAGASRLDGFELRPAGRHREKKSFSYTDAVPRERPFSFTLNRGHLLFYIRKAGRPRISDDFAAFKQRFATLAENSAAEWTVRLATREDAARMHEYLFSPPNPAATEAASGNDESLDDIAEDELRGRSDIGPFDKEQLIRARHGQGSFRRDLERLESGCRLTGLIDRRHLRASHIKPWRDSDDRERLDPHNGLLLSPHVAHLFDRGHISFSDLGDVLVSKSLNPAVLGAWAIRLPIKVRAFRLEQRVYLEYHRLQVFEKSSR